MRNALVLAALVALFASNDAHADLTLEYWYGVQDFTPFDNPGAGQFNPSSLQGLRNWDFTGQSKLSLLTVNPGSQHILKIVLRDRDNVGNGSGYTFSGNGIFPNNLGLMTAAMRFTSVPGLLEGTRDTNGLNGVANTVTVWSGTNTNPTSTQENINFAVQNFGADYFTIGQLYFSPLNMSETSPFQQVDGDVIYPLANVVVTAGSPGSGNLRLSKPNTPAPTFGTTDGLTTEISYDSSIWGPSGTSEYLLPFVVVPEPSSFLLVASAVSAVRIHRRQQTSKYVRARK
jgi:hypothetical protein